MSPLVLAALLAVAAVGLLLFAKLVSRAHTVVRFTGTGAALKRGALPPGLLSDLRDVARGQAQVDGTLQIHGQGDSLKVEVSGLSEALEQRVRNVVFLRRQQIRRP